MIDLAGKVAIVTGSAQGIGRGIAEKLASLNAHVVMVDVNAEGIGKTAAELQAKGYDVEPAACDISKREATEQLIEDVVANNGHLDILVNNAGINRDGMLHKLSQEQWDQVIAVNLTGTFNMMQPAVRHMRERESGRIVNISSASWLGNIGQANYAASKAGIVGLTKTAARELGRKSVTCNAICPGFIDTDMTRGVPEKVWDIMVSKIPMGRAGKPEDVGNMVAFLASDQAAYITGEVINVGGGMVL